MFKHRIGNNPHANGRDTAGVQNCSDVWELKDGSFAVIGIRKTSMLTAHLPADASCGPDEEIVILPRDMFIGLKNFIPET